MNYKAFQRATLIGATSMLMAFAGVAGAAQGQGQTQAMTPDQISAQYDAAMKQCKGLKGNDKDVCKKRQKPNAILPRLMPRLAKKRPRHDTTPLKLNAMRSMTSPKKNVTPCLAMPKTNAWQTPRHNTENSHTV